MSEPPSLARFAKLIEAAAQGPGSSVELLLSTMPSRDAELLRAAAISHDFNPELLSIIDAGLAPTEAAAMCEKFLRFAMVTRVEGAIRLHDEARQHLFHWWLSEDRRQEFREISGRLSRYFDSLKEKWSNQKEPDEAARTTAEHRAIFHLLGADQKSGFDAFTSCFHAARKKFLLSQCQALLGLAMEYDEILDPVRRLWITHLQADLYFDVRKLDEAKAAYQLVLSDEHATPQLRVRSLYRLGNLEREERDWAGAEQAYLQAKTTAASLSDLDGLEYRIRDGLASVYRETGRLDEADSEIKAVIKQAEANRNLPALAEMHNSMGMLLQKSGDTKLALTEYKESLSLLQKGGEAFRQAQVLNNLGLAYADMANWTDSVRYLEQCLEIERQRGHTHGQAKTMHNLVRPYIALNQEAKALEAASNAASLFISVGDWFHAGLVKRVVGRIMRRKKDIPQARKAFAESVALFRQAKADNEATLTQTELDQIELLRGLPWYAWVAFVVLGLLILVFAVAINEGW